MGEGFADDLPQATVDHENENEASEVKCGKSVRGLERRVVERDGERRVPAYNNVGCL